jgi:hypothetical protein
MRRSVCTVLFAVALAVLTLGWVRGAWQGPLNAYAFDFSINYTGARLLSLRAPDRPLYDRATLKAEATPYTAFDRLYTALFLTYIQTPITAVLTLPLAHLLDFHDARLAFLIISNALLVAAIVVTVLLLRPSPLLVVAAFIILGTFEPMWESLRLGQVDGIIVCALALSFSGLRRRSAALTGLPLSLAAILKLSPVFVIGLFVWRRCWRVVSYALAGLVALMLLSVLVAGWQNNVTFVRDMVPRLMHGSPWYYNVSVPGAVLRAYLGRQYWAFEDEPPALPVAVRLALIAVSAAIVVGGYIATRRDVEAGFMLAIACGILVSPVSWTFYMSWLTLSLLWLVRRYEDRRAWGRLTFLVPLYVLMAVKPDDLARITPEIHAVPLKAMVLLVYAGLLAWEARSPVPETGSARQGPVSALQAGQR